MRVASLISQALEIRLPVRSIFEFNSIEQLAVHVESLDRGSLNPIQICDRDKPLQLSFSQQRLWFIDRLEGGSAQYNQVLMFCLEGQVDVEALQKAFDDVIARHEVLRTNYVSDDQGTVQRIHPARSVKIALSDLVDESLQNQQLNVKQLAKAEVETSFDLASDSMIRCHLVQLHQQKSILLMTLHHIASDGWSLSILIKELVALYQHHCNDTEIDLPNLPIQYADYAQWQRSELQGETLDDHLAYWKQQLAGIPLVHGLPLDAPRPAEQSYEGASYQHTLDEQTTRLLRELAASQNVTLFMVLHAAFSCLLNRYSGESDILIGTTIANREQSEIADLIGFFVNTLILRSNISIGMRFTELLEQCRQCALNAYEHQQVPFDLLVEELQPDRSLSFNPLFQVMLSMDNIDSVREVELAGATMSSMDSPVDMSSQFDLTLDVSEAPANLHFNWGYATDLFHANTIERFARHFEHILQNIVHNRDGLLTEVTRLNGQQRHFLVNELNETVQESLIKETWPALFERQVEFCKDNIAAQCGDDLVSYQDLEAQSRKIALRLKALGLGRDQVVALLDTRGLDLLAMIIGVLRAGAAYLPLDPSHPKERWHDILVEAQPQLILIGNSLVDSAQYLKGQGWSEHVRFQKDLESIEIDSSSDLALPELNDLAYVIYTSGSTGKPKGVMIEHRGMINNMLSKLDPLSLNKDDIIAQTASQCFDISVWQFLTAPVIGAKVSIFNNDIVCNPQRLLAQLKDQHISIWEPVPSVIQAVLHIEQDLPDMRWVLPTGEALSKALASRWFEQYPAIPLMNAYGPAECSDDVAFEPMYGPVDRVLIGSPVANAHLHVVDDQLELVPIGVVGELAVSGAVVGRGYLNAPELTESVLKENPFARHAHDTRLYLTGDLVRRMHDGRLEYIARKDFQVKIRGFRIELGEIEAKLLEQSSVKEAVVIAHENSQGSKQLIAYVSTDTEVSAIVLRDNLKSVVPDYMVPAAIIVLDALPLNNNGKVDRKALPEPDLEALQSSEYEAPVGNIEMALAHTWQALLEVEQVGRFDNFFRLGGHSLLVMRLIEMLREYDISMDVRKIFETENLAELATSLGDDRDKEQFVAPENLIPEGCKRVDPKMLPLTDLNQIQIDSIAHKVPGGHSNIQDIYPLTPLQEGILFDHILSDQGDTYLASVLLRFDDKIKLNQYLNAMQRLVDRHDTLRSAVHWEDLPNPIQVVYRQAQLSIEELALDPSIDAINQFEKHMAFETRHIDLTKAPIVGIVIAKDTAPGSDAWLLLQQQHHITCDQVSMEILFSEIVTLLSGGHELLLPPKPYREFVAHTLMQSDKYDLKEYFIKSLEGVDEPTAPFGLLDTHRIDKRTEELIHTLPSDVAAKIHEHTHQLGATPASLFHLAWGLVLARCCNRDDVVFGTVMSGRLQGTSGAASTFGLFINTLPIRLNFSELSILDALSMTRTKLVELLDYEQAPLVEAQRCSELPGSTPLFSAILNYRHEPEGKVDGDAIIEGIDVVKSPGDISNYLFDMSVSDEGGEFTLTASIDADIGAHRVMNYMVRALEEILKAMTSAPDTKLIALPVISKEEQTRLLSEFNHPVQHDLIDKTWPEIFAEQVLKSPDKIVARCGEATITYAELDQRSRKVASAILKRSLGRENIIGLLDHRGIELLVMIVGVLRSGAAYLPIDPTHPKERWLDILNEGEPDLLITGNELVVEQQWLSTKWKKQRVVTLPDLLLDAEDDRPPLPGVALNDLAYVIFTSGSTGKPKGVMIEHRGMINNMRSKLDPLGLSSDDIIAQTASQCFDISVWQFLTAPILGACVLIVTNETTRDPQALLSDLKTYGVSIWEPVPSVIQALLPFKEELPSLRWVLPTGEALVSGLVERWFKQYPNVPLMNAYGPAECSDDVSFQEIRGPVERVFIGKPVANARLHVVDNHLGLVPTGVVGELAVSGPVVGRGYLNRPDLTEKVFKDNPYAQDDMDKRIYLTGDLAKRAEDGSLEYIGRKDFQVKIRGFRIELGEIEARLSQHALVKNAVVIAYQQGDAEKRLVAYITYEGVKELSVDELKAHLLAALPEYMVPSLFVPLDKMPLTPNGKVDRKNMPEPDFHLSQQGDFEAPLGDTEEKMARIWKDLLHLDRVGRNDNFFDLGGNSILIIAMMNELRNEGIDLTANDIYQCHTLKECCARFDVVPFTFKEWLDEHAEGYCLTEVKQKGEILSVLLLPEASISSLNEIPDSVDLIVNDVLPDFIRCVRSPETIKNELAEKGLTALSDWSSIEPNACLASLNQQLIEFESHLLNGHVEAEFEFSPMQSEISNWDGRDDFEWVSVNGTYSPETLQQSFYELMCEQDLLRSLANMDEKKWRLISVSSLSAICPVIDMKGVRGKRADKLLKKVFKTIQAKQYTSILPYMPVWVQRSDTLHQLIMMDDHLISDGTSSMFIQQRLEDILKKRNRKVDHHYREYVNQITQNTDEEALNVVESSMDLKRTAQVTNATITALDKYRKQSLRSLLIQLPLDQNVSPVVQAFSLFKDWVAQRLDLTEFSMVLSHYGRTFGDKSYFDQVGLFLEKYPFVVRHDTELDSISNTINTISQQAISFMALEKSGYEVCQRALPGLSHEVHFNFEGELNELDVMKELLVEKSAEDKLKAYYGILFEAYTKDNQLIVHCAFRGKSSDKKKLLKLFSGQRFVPEKHTPVSRTQSYGNQSYNSTNQTKDMSYSIEVKDVRKHYGSFEAVKGLSFSVQQGICFGILGPNGAGKTSLLGMMEGITDITSGSIRILDMDVKTQIKQIQPHIGVQLQQNNYFEFLKVGQLLNFYKDLRSANSRKANGVSVEDLLERLNLKDKVNFKVDELSGGQKQRLSIAIALLEDPDILFLDEPTSALDPHSRHHVWEFIETLKKDKSKTIILTTHYMEEAETLCDELMIMSEGKIISQGRPRDLVNMISPHHEINLQLGSGVFDVSYLKEVSDVIDYKWEHEANQLSIKTSKFTETLKDILNVSEDKKIEILNFNIERPNLEDVFLTSTQKDLTK